METVTNFIRGLFQPPYTYLLCFALAVFVLGAILRFACGAVKSIPRSAAACFAILFIYVISICAMGAEGQSKVLLSCLPFLGEVSDATGIYVMMRTSFTAFLLEAAQMFVLAFIINLLQDLLDRFIKLGGSSWLTHFFVWYFWQCVIVLAGLAAAIPSACRCFIKRRSVSATYAKICSTKSEIKIPVRSAWQQSVLSSGISRTRMLAPISFVIFRHCSKISP